MKKLLRRTLIAVLTITMAACTSVEDPPGGGGSGGSAGTGGTGGTAGTGGTSGTGGSSGTGGTGGTNATPTVTLTATPISVANGTVALLSWDVTNAASCEAQGDDWDGTRLADGGSEERFIYKDSRFELSCTGPGGTGSDEVDVSISTSQLLVSVDMDFYLVKAGDNFNVDVTVSNPGARTVQNVFVTLIVPQYVIINPAALPSNATCTGACDAGEMIEWDIGAVDAGTVSVVSVEPEVALTVPDGEDIAFEVTTSADGEPDEVVSENTTEGDSDLGLGLAQTPSEPQAGEGIVYTLSYDNSGPSPLSNVELTLTLPGPVAFVSANNGGTLSDGVVTWSFTEIAAGASGVVEARVDVNPTIPPGAQLRAAAGASVDGTPAGARATTLGSVGDGTAECQVNSDCPTGDFCVRSECTAPLLAEVAVDVDPVVENGELFRVSVTVTNPTDTETVNGVNVEVPLPPGIADVSASQTSTGGVCTSSFCVGGQDINWTIGSLGPGESRVVSLEPVTTAASAGTPMTFRANATSTNAKTANAQATIDVVTARALNLRVVESANPVATGQAQTYTLHYANQSNSTINDVELTLTTSVDGDPASEREISWDLGRLDPGEGGARQAVVTVDAAAGEQLRAEAIVFDVANPTTETRATVQTPVGQSPLMARVEVNPDPSRQDELTNVSVTVTNPSTSATRNNINVQVRLPQGIADVSAAQTSAGGTCTSSFCVGGNNINWMIGTLEPGESRVVSFEPVIQAAATDGLLLLYQADVREDAATAASAVQQTSVLAGGAATVQGDRVFNLSVVESANPVESGQSLTYTLHYANQSNSTINNVELVLTTPTGGTTVTDAGGGTASQGVVTWDLDSLDPGEGGTRQAVVTVDAATGQQIRTEAVVFDSDDSVEQTRATVQTPVGQSSLSTSMISNEDPTQPDQTITITVTVENTSATVTENSVTLELQLPAGIDDISNTNISAGGTCTSSFCVGSNTITWDIGTLIPGDSTAMDLQIDPTVSSGTPPGFLLFFESQTLVGGESRVVAGTTVAVEPAP